MTLEYPNPNECPICKQILPHGNRKQLDKCLQEIKNRLRVLGKGRK